jgi:serine/threonine-protein kinase
VLAVRPGEGGQAARGSTVTLTVSRGPRVVPVPDVAGLSAAEAAQQLQAQGFVVTSTQGSPANPVTGTSPAAGTEVRPGTSVVIITG